MWIKNSIIHSTNYKNSIKIECFLLTPFLYLYSILYFHTYYLYSFFYISYHKIYKIYKIYILQWQYLSRSKWFVHCGCQSISFGNRIHWIRWESVTQNDEFLSVLWLYELDRPVETAWIIAVTYSSVAKLGINKYHREISWLSLLFHALEDKLLLI